MILSASAIFDEVRPRLGFLLNQFTSVPFVYWAVRIPKVLWCCFFKI